MKETINQFAFNMRSTISKQFWWEERILNERPRYLGIIKKMIGDAYVHHLYHSNVIGENKSCFQYSSFKLNTNLREEKCWFNSKYLIYQEIFLYSFTCNNIYFVTNRRLSVSLRVQLHNETFYLFVG